MGGPMVTGPSPDPTSDTADQMVVSVGPYIFHSGTLQARMRLARSRGSASPPQSTLSLGRPVQPVLSNRRKVIGVACKTVAPEERRRSRSCRPSLATARLATTSLAPVLSGG